MTPSAKSTERKPLPANYRPGQPLSKRQLQVVGLIAQDLSDKQIAVLLCISPKTVRNHFRNSQKLTGCQTRIGTVLWYAARFGIPEKFRLSGG
jgi:DNA-binding CsgD family transcriptional regulator